ncbi:hypothetical protein niasHS_012212 [Heterodera schachtii]|uniref:Uncharacterized protein n=1 Tax=Heterodera schachtii TaxID=97005 RepID=A0ABD2IEG0_HETSC
MHIKETLFQSLLRPSPFTPPRAQLMGAELSILLGGQSEQRPEETKQKQQQQQQKRRKFKKNGVGVEKGRETTAKHSEEEQQKRRRRNKRKKETEEKQRGRGKGEDGREEGGKGRERVGAGEEEEKESEDGRERVGEGGKEKGREREAAPTQRNSALRANIMHHSPFRGLRRATFSSSSSTISCCSSVPCATANSANSYPYPRTHSTLMVIPSVRPPIGSSAGGKSPAAGCDWNSSSVGTPSTIRPQRLLLDSMDEQNNNNEQLVLHFPRHPNGGQNNNNNNEGGEAGPNEPRQSLVTQYGFQTHRPRPPLNRAIPPIPESRSNESIQSGLVARHQSVGSVVGIQQQTAQIIDENNPIDVEMAPTAEEKEAKTETEHLEMIESETEEGKAGKGKMRVAEKGGKASRLPKMMQRKGKAKERVAEDGDKWRKMPKSPLMSVAHSVKTRFTRLTTLRQSKEALPMSRSLEIGRQQSRIPTVCGGGGGDPMTKSWSLETTTMQNNNNNKNNNGSEMPRRGPMTTLMPSPRGMSRRMPTEGESDEHYAGAKIVQFAPLPNDKFETKELRKMPELEFAELNLEKPTEEGKEAKAKDGGGGKAKRTIDRMLSLSLAAEETPSDHSDRPPPLPESSPPQLCPNSSPPKTLRKSPQSFPPMGAHSAPISFADDLPPARVRPAKSALSVSFSAVPAERTREGKNIQQKEEREGKRRVFSTRSLRLVATRVCEASPLLVRRRRGRSAGRDGTGDRGRTKKRTAAETKGSVPSTRLMPKRHSVPAEPSKVKSKSFSESASAGSAASSSAEPSVHLRAVRSVADRRAHHQRSLSSGVPQHRRVAPLAESESSRVADENSPAVEQCGTVPWITGRNERRTFFGGKIKNGRANATPKESKKSKSSSSSSAFSLRPTLAQLLASPQPRKKSPGDSTETKARSGLIDDEIGDQPMLISASPPAVLSADFRLIDELSNGPSPAVTQQQQQNNNNNNHRMSPSSPAVSSDAPSSVVLIAEQWQSGGADDPRGEVTVVQSRLEKALKIGGRKRNARPCQSDTKEMAKIKGNGIGSACKCQPNTSTAETAAEVTAAKRPSPAAHPPFPLSFDAKSEDGAAFFPVLLSDFRSDLCQLQDSVRRDLEELETLRLQNAILREQLTERDRIIASLQQQLRGQS